MPMVLWGVGEHLLLVSGSPYGMRGGLHKEHGGLREVTVERTVIALTFVQHFYSQKRVC